MESKIQALRQRLGELHEQGYQDRLAGRSSLDDVTKLKAIERKAYFDGSKLADLGRKDTERRAGK